VKSLHAPPRVPRVALYVQIGIGHNTLVQVHIYFLVICSLSEKQVAVALIRFIFSFVHSTATERLGSKGCKSMIAAIVHTEIVKGNDQVSNVISSAVYRVLLVVYNGKMQQE
jgi:hypothetical protein